MGLDTLNCGGLHILGVGLGGGVYDEVNIKPFRTNHAVDTGNA